jgi:putative transposase
MSRKRRPYLPGTAFHVTARTIGHEPWFDDLLCERIVGFLNIALARTDARLLAHALMPTHLHLIVHQRVAPLAQLLQPFLRQCALLVQRAANRQGYIFERRYRAKPCTDADYLRDVIAYVHRNPVAAQLCQEPAQYRWSSHAHYCGVAPALTPPQPKVSVVCELFAASEQEAASDRSAGYLRYYNWRDRCANLAEGVPQPRRPEVAFGSAFWARDFVSLPRNPLRRPDLRDIVLRALQELAPTLDLDTLRLRRGGRTVTAIRREVIRRALLSGHRGVDVARILNVSETTVSKVATDVLDRAPVRFGAQQMHHMGIGQNP